MDIFETVFLKILNMSVTASYVILAVILVRLLLKRVPKVLSYALWSVAAFRLVCPVSFSSVISIFNIGALWAQRSGESGNVTQPSVNSGNSMANTQLYAAPSININSSTAIAEVHSADPMQIVLTTAVVLWCLGMAAMLVYSIISYITLSRSVKQAVRLEANVYECDGIQSPFVLGIIKPKIFIPFRMNEKDKVCILCHERHHIHRFDHVIKPLAFLVLTVYWFHPLVWLAYLLMCKDMEMSCDEKVISLLGTAAKRDYCLSLLSVSANRRLPVAGPLFFGETNAKTRIGNVLGFKKPKAWALMLAVVLCVAVAAACAADVKPDGIADVVPNEKPIESAGSSSPENAAADDNYDISGRYEFEENVYTNPLSSFMAMKGYMPSFEITDNNLSIVDMENDTVEYSGTVAPAIVSKDEFDALFEDEIVLEGMAPDISKFNQCQQYAVYTDDVNQLEYRLYRMDDEVWLAKMANSHLWSIYRLVKTGSESTVGGFDGPENAKVISESMVVDAQNIETGSNDRVIQYPVPGVKNNHSMYTEDEYAALMDLETDNYPGLCVNDFDAKAESVQKIYSGYNPNDENADFMKTLFYSATELVYAENNETPMISISTAANKRTDTNEYYGAELNYEIYWTISNKDKTTVGQRDDILNTCQNSIQSILESKNRDELKKNNMVSQLQSEYDGLAKKLSGASITLEIVIESLIPVSE